MTTGINTINTKTAFKSIQKAAGAKKCWSCGCLHSLLKAIGNKTKSHSSTHELALVIAKAKRRLVDVQYDCLGCAKCYPADAINALGIETDACPTPSVEQHDGWSLLPGIYATLRYKAPVAVCTLTDKRLYEQLREQAGPKTAIVGMLQTENLGIERLIQNILANPNIRYLILCGTDSQQRIGHLPGQSLIALAHFGIDARGHIVNAKGKRPVIRNLDPDAVEHFRNTVEVVNQIGVTNVSTLLSCCDSLAQRNPDAAKPFKSQRSVKTIPGYLPDQMTTDPNGYFVIYADNSKTLLSMEHYTNRGVLDVVIEGKSAAEVYIPAIEKSLVSRLDHAAYLGRELARAEKCLKASCPYTQDGAPERIPAEKPFACGCNDKGGSP